MIFITLFNPNFLSVYVICTCLHLGTNGIFDNVNIDSFHSSSPSQKKDPLPSVWLQRALHRHRRDHKNLNCTFGIAEETKFTLAYMAFKQK